VYFRRDGRRETLGLLPAADGEAAAVRDKFLAGVPPSDLSPEERRSWAEFVATLEARTPRSIREVESTGSRLRRRLRREHRGYFANPVQADRLFERFEFDAMVGNATRATPLGNRGRLAEGVLKWQWCCTKIAADPVGEMELISADYPIARLEHEAGVVAIELPLSSSVLLVAVPWPGQLASAEDGELKRFGEFAWHFSMLVNLLLISQSESRPNTMSEYEEVSVTMSCGRTPPSWSLRTSSTCRESRGVPATTFAANPARGEQWGRIRR